MATAKQVIPTAEAAPVPAEPEMVPAEARPSAAEASQEVRQTVPSATTASGATATPAGPHAPPMRRTRQQPAPPARRIAATVLTILTCICLLGSAITLWAQQTLLNDTERWVQMVGPLAQDPEVVNALSNYVADQTVMLLQVQQRTQTALPQQAQFLSIPLTQVVRDFTHTHVASAMQTNEIQQAWVTTVRFAHSRIVATLRGEAPNATIENGALTINLVPIIGQALRVIQQQLPGIIPRPGIVPDVSSAQSPQQALQQLSQALGVQLPPNFGEVTVLQSDQLTQAQRVVKAIDVLSIALPILTLLLLIAALWLSVDRRRTLVLLGIGIVVCCLLVLLGTRALPPMVTSSIADPTAQQIAHSVIEQMLSYLVTSVTWLLVIGAVLAVVAFLLGKREWFAGASTRLHMDRQAWNAHHQPAS